MADRETLTPKQQEILEIILDIIKKKERERPFSILIKGSSGTGKTFLVEAIKNILNKDKKTYQIDNIGEVNLLLVKDINDFYQHILLEISTIEKMKALSKRVEGLLKDILRNIKGISLPNSLNISELILIKDLLKEDFTKRMIIFEEIDRKPSSIPLEDILNLIAYIREKTKLNVIATLNVDNLSEEDKIVFSRYAEKCFTEVFPLDESPECLYSQQEDFVKRINNLLWIKFIISESSIHSHGEILCKNFEYHYKIKYKFQKHFFPILSNKRILYYLCPKLELFYNRLKECLGGDVDKYPNPNDIIVMFGIILAFEIKEKFGIEIEFFKVEESNKIKEKKIENCLEILRNEVINLYLNLANKEKFCEELNKVRKIK